MKKICILMGLVLFSCMQAYSAVSVEQTTDPEYIINAGYSEALAEDIILMKNRANGKPVEPLYSKPCNGFVRFLKNAYAYIDPSMESEDRYHHNIQLSPSYKDL